LALCSFAAYGVNAQTPALTDADVGVTSVAGSTKITTDASGGKIYTVVGGGADIWGNADAFHYAYFAATGDFDYIVKVQDLQGPDGWTKAELMARQDDGSGNHAAGDQHISNMTTRSAGQNELRVQVRTTTDGASDGWNPAPVVRPTYPNTWLRLERIGNVFYPYYSTNGANWTAYKLGGIDTAGSSPAFSDGATYFTNAWPNAVSLGLAVTAHNDADATGGTAIFTDFKSHVAVPISISKQPAAAVSANINKPLVLSVEAAGDPIHYQWRKGGVAIAGAIESTYTINLAQATDAGTYSVRLFASGKEVISADSVVTTVADTEPPTVVDVATRGSFKQVVVKYSEPVSDSALSTSNYALDKGVGISSVSRLDASTVGLNVSPEMAPVTVYTLTINNVQDTAIPANKIAANSSKQFKTYLLATGSVAIRYYDTGNPGIDGVNNIVATQQPTRTDVRPDAQSASWENGANYAAQMEGVFIAPETGDYTFFICSDDGSKLFLSTDDTAANLGVDPVAQVTSWTNQREWAKEAGQSSASVVTISLKKGSKYFLRANQVEGGGGDGVAVGWELPSLAGAGPVVIPGSAFVFAVSTDNSIVNITKQPVSVTGTDGKFVSFSVAATGKSDVGNTVSYQWQKNGQNITGATGTTYNPPRLTLADNGTKFQCIVAVPGNEVTSDVATLTVIADTVAPVLMGVGAIKSPAGWDAGIMFDERIELASAGVQANYTLSGGTITGVTVYTNAVDMPGVVLNVTGLTAGSKYTLTVKNVADIYGNKITTATKEFTVTKFTWGAVGGNEMALGAAGSGVVTVGDNGFDLYSDGIGEWGTYDEATFVYEEVTGNFDKALRVEYQDLSSQWARAGLIARDVTNFGVDRAAQDAGAAGRYQKIHVNPQGPTLTGPGTAGNNSYEGNRRLDTGSASTSSLNYNNTAPTYPNAWCRMVREGQTFSIYRSSDGQSWTLLGVANWALTSTGGNMPDKMFVGPEYTPENGNVTDVASRGRFLAQIRDYGDTKALTSTDTTANKRKAVFIGNAKFTPDMGGHTGKAGDYAMDNGTAGNAMAVVADPSFLNAPAANDELSFSVWVKRYDINDSSAFWVRSRQGSTAEGGNSDRAFQAHVPWSDNNVVFDTVGCCDATTQRISASATTAAGYADLGWWTNNWRHFVFTKKADQKNVYIDGVLFLNGSSSNPLPTDIGEMMIGAETGTGSSMHAKIDDFAVFGKALTLAQAQSLFTGTAPSAVSGAQLLAFWDFNDAPKTTAVTPTVSAVKGSTGLVITFTGTLQSATAINGPWTDETATGTLTVPFTGAAKYFRAKQ
jgi:hypothetical protein